LGSNWFDFGNAVDDLFGCIGPPRGSVEIFKHHVWRRTSTTAAELIYQRMLARDSVEAAEQAQAFLWEKPLSPFYDEVLLEGLHLAQRDAERGLLDDERTLRIRDAVAEIIDDPSAHQDSDEIIQQEDALRRSQSPLAQLQLAEAQPKLGTLREEWRTEKPVLCIPGGGLLDEAAAMMIAQLLERQGIGLGWNALMHYRWPAFLVGIRKAPHLFASVTLRMLLRTDSARNPASPSKNARHAHPRRFAGER